MKDFNIILSFNMRKSINKQRQLNMPFETFQTLQLLLIDIFAFSDPCYKINQRFLISVLY